MKYQATFIVKAYVEVFVLSGTDDDKTRDEASQLAADMLAAKLPRTGQVQMEVDYPVTLERMRDNASCKFVIKEGGKAVLETDDRVELKEWVQLNVRRWRPASTPYMERADGRRFDLSRVLPGMTTCNSCLQNAISVYDIDKHVCKNWWEKEDNSVGS